jgi:chromosome segregation ATPase
MAVLDRKLADANDKFADQFSKLSKDLDMCYNAARQMHLAVCRPVMGLTSGIGILVISAGASGGCRVASVEPHLHVTPPNSNKMLQRGDLIIEIDGKDVRYENDKLVQNLLIGPVESQVKIVLQRAESDEVYSVYIQRGTAGAGVTTIIPDLLRDVKNTCTTLHGDIEKLRAQNGQLKEKVSQVSSMHENEVKQLRAVQADLQVQLDSQLRNVSNLQRDKALLEQGSKELGTKVDDLEKQLRAAKLKFQQDCDEIARLEAQREELKNGNNGAREALHKALADIKVMQSKTESQADTIAELERDKRKLQTEVADRDLNLAEMSKQLAMAVRQYQDAECEIGRLLQENKAISADVEAIKSQNEGLESQVRDLKKIQADATARLNDCDRLLRSSEKNDQSRVAMIEDLEKRLKAANHRQHQLVDELSAMTGEVNKIKDASNHGAQEKDERILELQEALDKERIFVDELSKKLATTELSKSEYKSKVSTLETRCSDLEKKVKAASERESGLQEEMRRASEELANLRTKSSGTIADLEDCIAELRAEMTANKNEVADLHDRLKHQLWDNNTLKTLVSEKDTRIEDAEKQLRAANLRLQELEARQQELLNELSKFKSTGAEQNSVLAAKDAQVEGLLGTKFYYSVYLLY